MNWSVAGSMFFPGGKQLLHPADLVSVDYKINQRGKLKSTTPCSPPVVRAAWEGQRLIIFLI